MITIAVLCELIHEKQKWLRVPSTMHAICVCGAPAAQYSSLSHASSNVCRPQVWVAFSGSPEGVKGASLLLMDTLSPYCVCVLYDSQECIFPFGILASSPCWSNQQRLGDLSPLSGPWLPNFLNKAARLWVHARSNSYGASRPSSSCQWPRLPKPLTAIRPPYEALDKGGTSVLRLGLPGGRSGRSLVYVSSARALAWSLAPDRYAMA
jgi:hypothetical protein